MVGAMLVDGWGNVGTMYAVDVGATLAQRAKLRCANNSCCCWANVAPTVGIWLADCHCASWVHTSPSALLG